MSVLSKTCRLSRIAFLAATVPVLAQVPSGHTTSPRVLEQQFHAAVSSYDHHQYPQAATQLEGLLRAVPQSFEVHELLGLTYGAEALNEKAVPHLQTAVNLKPDSAAARTNLAAGLLRIGKPRQAETEARKAVDLAPESYDANHTLAELLLRENRVKEAIPALEAAQSLNPTNYDNGYDLALAYVIAGRLPEARQHVDRLSSLADKAELHALRGRIDEGEGKFIDAANEFAAAARQDPTEENLFAWASELLLHRTYEPAIDIFRKATELYPSSPRLWVGLGMSLYSRGEYEEAVHSLLRGADLNPRDPRCYLFLSKAYLSSPDQAPAVIDHFRNYAALEPKNALAQFYFAMSYWKGLRVDTPDIDYKKVEGLLQRSIALDGTLAQTHLQLGILYNDEHAYDRSLPEYQRALELDPNLADAHFRLGRYYLHAGDKQKSQAQFDIFKDLQAKHQQEVDRERAEVQQFVVAAKDAASPVQP